MRVTAAIFDDLTTLADATRSRMLLFLERHELTVSELCTVLQLPQSTVSRHLKTLADSGWVVSRRDGTSRYYLLSLDDRGHAAPALVAAARSGQRDRRRGSGCAPAQERAGAPAVQVAGVLRDAGGAVGSAPRGSVRRGLSSSGASGARGRALDRRRSRLWHGPGQRARWRRSSRMSSRSIASGEMLQAARRRLRDLPTVDVRRGELEALPIADAELDAATLLLVLHHLPDPAAALSKPHASLKPGGRLVIADMLPHDREEYRQQMGHVWLGFGEDQMKRLLDGRRIRPHPHRRAARRPQRRRGRRCLWRLG